MQAVQLLNTIAESECRYMTAAHGSFMKIRPAVMDDYDQLCELFGEIDTLHWEALPDTFRKSDGPARSRERVSHLINDPSSTILVAERGDNLVGLVVAQEMPESPNPLRVPRRTVEIITVVVRKSARRL